MKTTVLCLMIITILKELKIKLPHNYKASDTLGDFIRRSPRSAKIARCARCSDCDFRRSRRSAYKIADIWHVRYRLLNSPSVPVPAILYVYCCESPGKPTHQVGRFYHTSFQNCHVAAIGEKNRQVSPHQSVAKIACDQIRRDRRIKSPGVSPA